MRPVTVTSTALKLQTVELVLLDSMTELEPIAPGPRASLSHRLPY